MEGKDKEVKARSIYEGCVKRLIDIILSFLGLIILLPVLLLIAIAIKMESKGPVFLSKRGLV